MSNLNSIENGKICKITWMINDVAEAIKEQLGLKESSTVLMKRNLGKFGVIVDVDGHRYAMSENAARAIIVD